LSLQVTFGERDDLIAEKRTLLKGLRNCSQRSYQYCAKVPDIKMRTDARELPADQDLAQGFGWFSMVRQAAN
jgi:hypothetical protein